MFERYKVATSQTEKTCRSLATALKLTDMFLEQNQVVTFTIYQNKQIVYTKVIHNQSEKVIKTWYLIFRYPDKSFERECYSEEECVQFIDEVFQKNGAFNYETIFLAYVNGKLTERVNG